MAANVCLDHYKLGRNGGAASKKLCRNGFTTYMQAGLEPSLRQNDYTRRLRMRSLTNSWDKLVGLLRHQLALEFHGEEPSAEAP
uniref:Uncharacterized protein n=1 Tax=Oryza glumipatula TaxID=40148 RepID=A0A0D9ZVZ2_9ORYZ